MSPLGSVEVWLRDLQDGHVSALGKLHERYWPALVNYARVRVRRAPQIGADEEDVVQAAFLSFYRAVREGRVPLLKSRENLLAFLTTIIARKAVRKAKGPRAVAIEDWSLLDELAEDPRCSPSEQALLADSYKQYVGGLPEKLRPFAEMSLAGMTHREIAVAVPCAVRTVERKMACILQRWRALASVDSD